MNTFLRVLSIAGAVSAITACGSSGGSDKPNREIGPITSGNYGSYIEVALNTLPHSDYGLPVGDSQFDFANSTEPTPDPDTPENPSTLEIRQAPCDGAQSQVTVKRNITGDTLQTLAGDYIEYTYGDEDSGCFWGDHKHTGIFKDSISQVELSAEPSNPTARPSYPVSDSTEHTDYTSYRLSNITTGDFIEINGGLNFLETTESVQDFSDLEKRDLMTHLARTSVEALSIKAQLGTETIEQHFSNFNYTTNNSSARWGGSVSTVVNGNTFDYTISMTAPIALSTVDNSFVPYQDSTQSSTITITAGLSTLTLIISGENQFYAELDQDDDGEVDASNTFTVESPFPLSPWARLANNSH